MFFYILLTKTQQVVVQVLLLSQSTLEKELN